jgi:hypothetical protein
MALASGRGPPKARRDGVPTPPQAAKQSIRNNRSSSGTGATAQARRPSLRAIRAAAHFMAPSRPT